VFEVSYPRQFKNIVQNLQRTNYDTNYRTGGSSCALHLKPTPLPVTLVVLCFDREEGFANPQCISGSNFILSTIGQCGEVIDNSANFPPSLFREPSSDGMDAGRTVSNLERTMSWSMANHWRV